MISPSNNNRGNPSASLGVALPWMKLTYEHSGDERGADIMNREVRLYRVTIYKQFLSKEVATLERELGFKPEEIRQTIQPASRNGGLTVTFLTPSGNGKEGNLSIAETILTKGG